MTVDDLIARLEAIKQVHPSAGMAVVRSGEYVAFSSDRVQVVERGTIVIIRIEPGR